MLSSEKLKEISRERQVNIEEMARHLVRAGLDQKKAVSAIRNWSRGLFKPKPTVDDIRRLATALSVEPNEISDWHSSCMYAPMSARKVGRSLSRGRAREARRRAGARGARRG